MRKMVVPAVLALLVLWVSIAGLAAAPDYCLGPGDTLRFSIWTWGNEPIVSQEATVRPDGKIALACTLGKSEQYQLGPGDVLEISVWGYQELHYPQLAIRPDGRIGYPLLGEVEAAGLTPEELTERLTDALVDYVIKPKVTVNVVKFRSVPLMGEFDAAGLTVQQLTAKVIAVLAQQTKDPKIVADIIKFRTTRVYVLGEVNKPGLCEIERDHNLLDAIGAAGGFTKGANRKRVYLVRKGQADQYTLVNLEKLLKKGDLSQNHQLNEGDVIFLARHKANYIHDILPFITALYQIKHFDDND